MAYLHRRRGRDKTVLSCRVSGVSTIGDQLLSCLVCSCVHSTNATRQDSFVSSPIVFIETGSRRDKTVLSVV